MARLDRVRLQSGAYVHHCEIATRASDLDVQHHINNVAVADIIQEGRARFFHASTLTELLRGRAVVVASILIDYANELRHPAPVHMQVGVMEIGRTSFVLAQIASQGGMIGAFAETVVALRENGAAAPLGEDFRAILENYRIDAAPRA